MADCIANRSIAYVGSIEEFGQSTRTRSLVMDQFATNFFGPVNVIKAALPTLRSQRNGHILLLTGISTLIIPKQSTVFLAQLLNNARACMVWLTFSLLISWTPRNPRAGHVLCITMGNRRLLRQSCVRDCSIQH